MSGWRQVGGLRLTREARAAAAGVLVALMLMMFVVIRIDPSGGPAPDGGLSAVSAKKVPAVWIVRRGQTFGLIADLTGLHVGQIEELNPGTDPGELAIGQRIRLREP